MTRDEHRLEVLNSICLKLRDLSIETSSHSELEDLRKEIDNLSDKVFNMIQKEDGTEYAWVAVTAGKLKVSCEKCDRGVRVTYTEPTNHFDERFDVKEEFYMKDSNDKEGLLNEIIKFIKDWDSRDEADARFDVEDYAYIDPVGLMDEYLDTFQQIRRNLQRWIDNEKKC